MTKFQQNWNWKQIDTLEQGSQHWLNMKLGTLSASNIYKAVAKPGSDTRRTYMLDLCAQVATRDHQRIDARALEWGKSFEEPARATFAFTHGKEIEEVPFVFKDENFREGASPDGIITDENAIVEIKAPMNQTNHLASIVDDTIKGPYQYQCQYQLRILEADYGYFVSFDARYAERPIHIIKVERDEKIQSKFDELIPPFIAEMDDVLDSLGIRWGSQWQQ